MILFVEGIKKDRKHFKISEFQDLQPVFDLYPRTYDIATEADNLKEAVSSIAEYLSSHNLTAWIEGEDFSKSLRDKALSLGLSLATAITPAIANNQRTEQQQYVRNSPLDETGFGTHPLDSFLWNVKALESNNGQNTKHKPVKTGISLGERAIGNFGLLPKTIKEIANRYKLSGEIKPEIEKLTTMPNSQLELHINKNPKLELELARKLADHVLKRTKGNPHKAAYLWLNGHNISPNSVTSDKLLHSNYVDKFKQVDKHNPFKAYQKPLNFEFHFKNQSVIHDQDFAEKVKKWYKKREDAITDNPTRTNSFNDDIGRIREDSLDDIKPDSMLDSIEKLKARIKEANK